MTKHRLHNLNSRLFSVSLLVCRILSTIGYCCRTGHKGDAKSECRNRRSLRMHSTVWSRNEMHFYTRMNAAHWRKFWRPMVSSLAADLFRCRFFNGWPGMDLNWLCGVIMKMEWNMRFSSMVSSMAASRQIEQEGTAVSSFFYGG